MFATLDPNLVVGYFALIGVAGYLFWLLIAWVRNAPTKPDPWDAAVEKEVESAPEICPHCSTPQPPTAWFCEHCGRAVGPYNNLMPYIQVFSEGEVLRNGTGGRLRKGLLVPVGYFLISVNFAFMGFLTATSSPMLTVAIFAGLVSYWALILKNVFRRDGTGVEVQGDTVK